MLRSFSGEKKPYKSVRESHGAGELCEDVLQRSCGCWEGGAHPGRNRLFGISGTPLEAWIGAGTHTCLLNSLASVLGMKRN